MQVDAVWLWPLVRGVVALAVFVVLLAAARRRWRRGGPEGGPGDVGLD
jgi:hypothetical protein